MMQSSTACFTEVLSEAETRVSALIDGESSFVEKNQALCSSEVHRYFHYQLIRQTLRGVPMVEGAYESFSWNQTRFSQLWTRVDAQTDD